MHASWPNRIATSFGISCASFTAVTGIKNLINMQKNRKIYLTDIE